MPHGFVKLSQLLQRSTRKFQFQCTSIWLSHFKKLWKFSLGIITFKIFDSNTGVWKTTEKLDDLKMYWTIAAGNLQWCNQIFRIWQNLLMRLNWNKTENILNLSVKVFICYSLHCTRKGIIVERNLLLSLSVLKMFWSLSYRVFLYIFDISSLKFNSMRKIQSLNIIFILDTFTYLVLLLLHLFHILNVSLLWCFWSVFLFHFCLLIHFPQNLCFTFTFTVFLAYQKNETKNPWMGPKTLRHDSWVGP